MKEKNKLILSAFAVPIIWILSLKLVFLFPLILPQDFKWYVGGSIGTILALIITHQFSKLNKVSKEQIGLNWEQKTPQRLLVGFLMGTALSCVMIFAIVHLTELEISRNEDSHIAMAFFWMLPIIPLAFMEEVAFRGFVFFNLEKIMGLRFTIIITSILFAYYHDLSGATFTYQLLGPGVWGIIYGIAAIGSKGLAVPTGIHIAANFVLASLGMKDNNQAIWVIDYPSEVTEIVQSHTETIGIYVQVMLLLLGICMTEWYVRRRLIFQK